MGFINKTVEQCHYEYLKLVNACHLALEKLEMQATALNRAKLQKEVDKAEEALTKFSNEVYAKAVYDAYSCLKPTLIRIRTGAEYAWDEVFKPSFTQLDALALSMLVALVENSGGYRLK